MKRRGELLMVEQAIKKGWSISPKARTDALDLIAEILSDATSTEREVKRAQSTRQALEATNGKS